MTSILTAFNVLIFYEPFLTKMYGVGRLHIPCKIDRFLREEDDVLVSPHLVKDNTHMFHYMY